MEEKIYKIRNGAGLWSSGGSNPTFSKRGKVWTNLGHVKSHLDHFSYYSEYKHGKAGYGVLPDDDLEIVEFIINYNEGAKTNVKDFVLAARRRKDLEKKFGACFSELVTRIEAKNEQSEYQWVLLIVSHRNQGDQTEFNNLIKSFKLKMNVDYKRVIKDTMSAYAFKSKIDAMQLRLAFSGNIKGIDIQQYVETNLDTDDE